MTADELRAFEADIAAIYNTGAIHAPIHLDGGNEEQLIEIFRDVRTEDWILGTWRQHYHCLLKGVPPDELKAAILLGRSITLCFPAYRVLSSAIAGGILPIAVGLGMGIKRRGGTERVWAFVGDMTAMAGLAHECMKYAQCKNLPIVFVIEDNGKSVVTDTAETWDGEGGDAGWVLFPNTRYFPYDLPWPHSGAGRRINF